MTKVEAIERVLKQNGGSANLNTIYDKIKQFYPKTKKSSEWEAKILGVIYYDEMIETYEHVVNGLKNNNWLI